MFIVLHFKGKGSYIYLLIDPYVVQNRKKSLANCTKSVRNICDTLQLFSKCNATLCSMWRKNKSKICIILVFLFTKSFYFCKMFVNWLSIVNFRLNICPKNKLNLHLWYIERNGYALFINSLSIIYLNWGISIVIKEQQQQPTMLRVSFLIRYVSLAHIKLDILYFILFFVWNVQEIFYY